MNKTELIAEIAKKTGLTKKAAEDALKATIETIEKTLTKKGGKVQLVGFGTFETKTRPARTARNPQTGKEMKVAAKTVPVFKAGKALKDKVAK